LVGTRAQAEEKHNSPFKRKKITAPCKAVSGRKTQADKHGKAEKIHNLRGKNALYSGFACGYNLIDFDR